MRRGCARLRELASQACTNPSWRSRRGIMHGARSARPEELGPGSSAAGPDPGLAAGVRAAGGKRAGRPLRAALGGHPIQGAPDGHGPDYAQLSVPLPWVPYGLGLAEMAALGSGMVLAKGEDTSRRATCGGGRTRPIRRSGGNTIPGRRIAQPAAVGGAAVGAAAPPVTCVPVDLALGASVAVTCCSRAAGASQPSWLQRTLPPLTSTSHGISATP